MNVGKEVPEEHVCSSGAGKLSTPDTKLENLLEQLRAKHSQASGSQDSWNEFAKQIRMASLERKQYRESAVVHESLEKLQSVITASSLNQILERIDSACQKLGMKYKPQGNQIYISTSQFYVEITCDITPNNRSVRDVKITHHGAQTTIVPAMTQALRQASVALFMDHIKGFLDMYNVSNDHALGAKYFIVLQSLESDIEKINKCTMQSKNISLGAHLYSTPLGLIQPRSGGLPTKLTFFITPYDFLNEKDQAVYPMTLDTIKTNDLGASATIGVAPHPNTHQLQLTPLVNYARSADNRVVPHFAPCNNVNSVPMQAAFVLKFKKPIALSETAINQIERLNPTCTFSNKVELMPMLDAIVKSSELEFPAGSQRFTVVLPGQVQSYFINNLETSSGEPLRGGLVHSIPFSHPTVIPQVILRLRQQLMINSMILSCVRSTPSPGDASRKPINLELKLVTNQLLTASFKHPFHDSMVAVDVDISELNSPRCSIFGNVGQVCTNSHASKVIQRSYSIPITIRAILRQTGHQEDNVPPPTKKVKTDHAETIQKLVDLYTARGHYMPYGSVNTASSTCTKNIQSNKYCLCLRRFSGYKRSSSSHLKSSHSLLLNSSSINTPHPAGHPTVSTHLASLPTQAADRSRISNAPMLASLLDEKDQTSVLTTTTSTSSTYPLVSPPTQSVTPQQQAPILTDLLEGLEGLVGAEKKARKNRNPKTATDNVALMPTGTGVTVSSNSPSGRKRKQSTSKEVVKELTTKVQAEVSNSSTFQPASSQAFSMAALMTPSPTTAMPSIPKSMSKPAFPKPTYPVVNPSETPLTKLLHGLDEEQQRTKLNVKTVILTAADVLEQERVQQEASLATGSELKLQLPSKVAKRKSADDKKVLKQQSASVDSSSKEKKLKRSDSVENTKLKESKSFDSGQSGRTSVKSKASKPQTAARIHPLNVKAADDRSSPKDKAKKPTKKKTPKSPANSESAVQGSKSNQDIAKMTGFYGASNLKSLPKIPKRKIDETQASPTSPTPPSLTTMTQRSPIISNRSLSNDQPVLSNRVIPLVPSSSDLTAKRPALLPTPCIPPMDRASMLQKNKSLDDVIHRLNSQSSTTSNYTNPTPANYNSRHLSLERPHSGSPALITSPDDSSMMRYTESAPVHIPIQTTCPEDPTSPVMEFVTQAPKTIPLDTSRLGRTQAASSSANQNSDRSQTVSSSSSGGSSLNSIYT